MYRIAMTRRTLQFERGALVVHSIQLTFMMDTDGQIPLLAVLYPIHDSNGLIHEYVLLAKYFVVQRLVTHAIDRACLRSHDAPLLDSMDRRVVSIAKATMEFI